MANLRDPVICEAAAVACTKRRDALYFFRFFLEQTPASATLKGHILPNRKGPNQEGSYFCQSRRVIFLPLRRVIFLLIRKVKGHILANPEGSFLFQSEGSIFSQLEGSQSGGFLFLSTRKCHIFFPNRGVQFLVNFEGSHFAKSEGSQSGGVLFLPIQTSHIFASLEGSLFY